MVVASFCETLRMLRNMNFNLPLYDIMDSTVLRKLLVGYINIVFKLGLGINIQLSVEAVLKYYEVLWVTKFGQKLRSFVGQSSR